MEKNKFALEPLEPRLLLSADGAMAGTPDVAETEEIAGLAPYEQAEVCLQEAGDNGTSDFMGENIGDGGSDEYGDFLSSDLNGEDLAGIHPGYEDSEINAEDDSDRGHRVHAMEGSRESAAGEGVFFQAEPGQNRLHLDLTWTDEGWNVEIINPNDGATLHESAVEEGGEVVIQGNHEIDDVLTVEISESAGAQPPVIVYHGGDGGFDQLNLTGATEGPVEYLAEGPDSGTIHAGNWEIRYTGLEPITDNMDAADRLFTATASGDVIRLRNADEPGMMIIESDNGTFESIAFPNPANSLTINAGDGDDEIHVESLDPAYIAGAGGSGDPELHLAGGAGTDMVFARHYGDVTLSDSDLDGGSEFNLLFDDTPEQVVVSGGEVNASAYTGVAVVIPGAPDWLAQGPDRIDSTVVSDAPFPQSGAVEAVAIHPANDDIMFAATVNGGVWRTTDGGVRWTPLTDDFPSLSFTAIAVHSHDAGGDEVTAATPVEDLVVFAGTGERSANFEGGFAIGLMRSQDGGSTWELVGGEAMAGLPISEIIAKRIGGDDVVLAAAEGKAEYESLNVSMAGTPDLTFADNGAAQDTITRSAGSWVDDGFAQGQIIRFDGSTRNDANYLVASVSPTVITLESAAVLVDEGPVGGVDMEAPLSVKLLKEGGIFRSDDGGDTFSLNKSVDPDRQFFLSHERHFPTGSVTDLAADPGNENRIYAAVRGGGVYRSDDGGQTWTATNNGLTLASDGWDNDGFGYEDDFLETAAGAQRILLAVQEDAGSAANTVFAGLVGVNDHFMGVFQSADQGANWTLLGNAPPRVNTSMATATFNGDGNLTFDDNNPADDTITRSEGSWIREGFIVGHRIVVSSSGSNDNTYTVAGVAHDVLTLDPGDALTNEAGAAGVSVRGYPQLTFANANPDTITRNAGNWINDGFVAGAEISVSQTAMNNGTFTIANVTPTVLTLVANDTLTVETDNNALSVSASAVAYVGPSATQPQAHRGSQGELHFSLTADEDANLYLGGDRPPHIFRWDQGSGMWDHIVEENSTATRSHADSRFLILDGQRRLLDGDDGGIYRLLNPGMASTAQMAGSPNLTFLDANPDRIQRSAGSWIADGFFAGQRIGVSGSGERNDGAYVIQSLTATTLTLVASASVNAEGPRSGMTVTGYPALAGNPNLTFADANPDTITRAAGSWIADGFVNGAHIEVSGSSDNDGVYRIANMTATVLTLEAANALTAEGAVNNVHVWQNREWKSLNAALGATEVLSASYDPVNNVIFAGTQDNGVIEQPYPEDGVDNDGDGIVDEPDERFRWGEVIVAEIRPGDGNTTAIAPLDLNGDGQFDEARRYTMSNNLNTFGQRVFDANGDLIAGTENLVQLAAPVSLTYNFTVNTANERLRINDHGLSTGDGPLTVRAAGGGSLPAELAEGELYWAIRSTDDHIQLAANQREALDGNPINLTTIGSGTRQLTQPFISFFNDNINGAANTVTIPNHGLANGQGPFRITTSRGADLPLNIVQWANYWVVVLDNNTIQLAFSQANANAGGPVANLDDDGAGTFQLNRRFSGLDPGDASAYTSGFRELAYVINDVDPTRMALGLDGIYVSGNIGSDANPHYDGLDTIQRVFRHPNGSRFQALAYGGVKNGTPNADVLYAASGDDVFIRIANAMTANPNLVFNDNGAMDDTITRSSGDWTADGFAAGQHISIFGTANNDGTYEVASLTANTLTLESFESLNNEGPVNDVAVDIFVTETLPGATSISALVLDADDHDVAYASSDSTVYKRTSPGTWEVISQRLHNFRIKSLEFVEIDGQDVLLAGGASGVFRAMDPQTGSIWTELGRFLPNTLARDIDFQERDDATFDNPNDLNRTDVLLAATQGRGAWTIHSADAFLDEPTVIGVTGGAGADQIRVERRDSNASIVDIFVNSSEPVYSLPFDGIQQIVVEGQGGDDELTIDSSNGPLSLPEGIRFDGGADTNTIILEGTNVYDVQQATNSGVTTVTFEDTRGGETSEYTFENASLANNLQEADDVEVVGSLLRDFFLWLDAWQTDNDPNNGSGAAEELALIGRSLPRILSGTDRDVEEPIADPVEGANQIVQSGGVGKSGGLERLIESGPNGFSLFEIGTSILNLSDLRDRLDDLDDIAGNVTLDESTDRDGDSVDDVILDIQIVRNLNGEADVVVQADHLGGAIDLSGHLDVSLDVELNLTLGVESSDGFFIETLGGASGLALTNLQVDGELQGGGQFGFLEIEIGDAQLTTDPSLALNIELQDPSGGDEIRIGELTGALTDPSQVADLAQFNITGSGADDLVFIVSVDVAAFLPGQDEPFDLGDAEMTATWADITQPDSVGFTFSAGAGQDLIAFLEIGSSRVLEALETVQDALSVMDVDIPEIQQTLDDIVGFVNGFEETILDPLRDPVRGSVSFTTLQDLIASWTRGLNEELEDVGLHFDGDTKELTYELTFTHHFGRDGDSLPFGFDLGGNGGGLDFDAEISVEADVAFETLIGIDLDALLGGADFEDVFFLRDTTFSGELTLNFNELDLDINIGSQSVSMEDGELVLTATLAIDPSGADANSDEKITLQELSDASFEDLVSLSGTGGLDATLPFSADLSFDVLSGLGFATEGDYVIGLHTDDLFGEDPMDVSISLDGSISLLGQTLEGMFTFQSTDLNGERVTIISGDPFALTLFDGASGGTDLLTATGSGHFVLNDDGVVGEAEAALALSVPGLSLTGDFSVRVNTTETAFNETFDVAGDSVTLDLPEGPYLQVAGEGVSAELSVAGLTQTISGNFAFEQQGEEEDRVVLLGLSDVSATFNAGPLALEVSGGSGGFILKSGGVAGVATVESVNLTGVPSVTVSAVNLQIRLNNTGGDVNDGESTPGPIEINVGGETVSFEFTGSYFHDYFAIAGGAEIGLAGFVSLTGDFRIERAEMDTNGDSATETVFKVGVDNLNFTLQAGSLDVLSFNEGSGAFIITDEGLAGVADMQFEVGLIGLSGDIGLEVNTLARNVSASVMTPTGNESFSFTDTEFLRVCITDAFLQIASTSIPIPGDILVEVDTGTGAVVISDKTSGTELVSIAADGTITTGLSFDDFAINSPYEFVSLLRQLLVWLDDLSNANAFDVEIPFTNTTLGEALDWAQLFIDEFYSHLISVELQSGNDIDQLIADEVDGTYDLANAQFQVQIGEDDPVEVTVNGSFGSIENPSDPMDSNTLVGLFNNAFMAAGIASQVVARRHEEAEPGVDRFVIALQPEEIAKMSQLNLVDLDDQIEALGFGPRDGAYGDEDGTEAHPYTTEQVGVETQRYTTEEFFVALGDLLGITVNYDPARLVYTYEMDEEATYQTTVPFNFGGDLGDLGGAEVEGLLNVMATVGFEFTLGFDLGPAEVPRILSTTFIPVPSNGQINEDANFEIFFNDDLTPTAFQGAQALTAASTADNNSIEDLADDFNDLFATQMYNGQPVSDWLVAQQAGNGLAISVKEENLGVINRLSIRSRTDDPFSTELGFGIEVVDLDGDENTENDRYYISTSESQIKGLFLEDVEMSASLQVNTETDTGTYPEANPNGLTGSFRFGFVELSTNEGAFGTLEYDGTTPNPIGIDLGLRNESTGSARFYLADLFQTLESTSFDELIDGPNFEGSFLARLRGLSINGFDIGNLAGSDPEISVWIPDINDLEFNPDPYDGSNTGIFLTYPDFGHLQNFQDISFAQFINALRGIVDNLSQLSGFGFLDQKLPVIDASVNDLLDYAAKFAEIIENAANQPAESLQDSIAELESQVEDLFDLDPSVFSVEIDTNGITPASLRLSGGNASTAATTTIDPSGDDNSFVVTAASNGSEQNGITIRLAGDGSVSGDSAQAEWDETNRVVRVAINPGETTAGSIVDAINAMSGAPVTASLSGGETGEGLVRTTALKFSFDFTAAYAELLPVQLDLNELVNQLAGDSDIGGFLDAATTLIQVEGSGVLDVAMSASLALDFGIDVTNPSSPEPFFYDSTGITLLAKVLGRDIEIETSLGSVVGIFIKDGEVTLDQDGDPETDPGDGDRGATFTVNLNDTNGDSRIYLSENWFTTDIIDIDLTGGLSVSLPIYAPVESIPLGSTEDNNGDGRPDNELYIEISDFLGLFNGEDVVTIAAPDLNSLFADLDFCAVLDNAGVLIDGLDSFLGSIEDGLREMVESNSLPMLGDGFGDAANFISDFRNGLLASIQNELDNAGGSATTLLENALKKAFWETLGPDGIDILVDPGSGEELDPSLGFHQLDVMLDCETGLVVNLRLRKTVALVDTSENPIDFDIGVPGFGLEVEGNVDVSLGFDLRLGFGLNMEDGFYFDSSAGGGDPELRVFFEASIPGLAAKGTLAFLQLDVSDDPDDPSFFVGQFVVDLKDPDNDGKLTFAEMSSSGVQFDDIFDFGLEAEIDLNLDLAASFGGNTAFPRVVAEFHLDWRWDLEDGAQDPQVVFSNVALDLGTFISDFLDPILKEIRKVTEPLDPIVEIATARLPVLSDLAGQKVTLLDLAEAFGVLEPSTRKFIDSVIQVVNIINSIPTGEGTILIPFGSFSLGMDESGNRSQINVLDQLGSTDFAGALDRAANTDASETYMNQVSGFAGDIGSLDNFSIPVFDNPGELFNLFIGEPVRLVEWRMPTFKFEFTYTQKIAIYPPLYAHFGGTIGAEIDIGFGYDTFGIQKFISSETKNAIDLFDGFYVIDFDENGNERPELELRGEIFAGASIDLLIVEAGVTGGIFATIQFDLNDGNDDGKVRISEIVANAQMDPRCIFDIHGEMGLFLEAFLKIDLFFFSIDKTWRFAEITLFEFDITCPEPILASKDGSGELTLHIGSRAEDREEIDTNDTAETVVVTHLSGDSSSEEVEVQWGSYKQTYDGVTKISVPDAGAGDDVIDVRGIKVPVDLRGGVGNDTIYLSDGAQSEAHGGDGNDIIVASSEISATDVEIFGDDGNDVLTAGPAPITIHGGRGKDIITGSPGGDHLFGDDGEDTITGGDGDDEIDGGGGGDDLDGEAGNDYVFGGSGVDTLRGSRGNDILDGGEDEDVLYGGGGNDLLIGGEDDDKAYGHGGVDLLIGDAVATIGGLAPSIANLSDIVDVIAAIPEAGIQIVGLTGSGDDFLIGGGNVDALFGGDGNDFLFGGNMLDNGETQVIEEDHNDFFDGGPGDDEIFGDDALGRTGDRDTGIEIRASIWFDNNKDDVRNDDEVGFGGVTVQLRKQSDDSLIAEEETESDGSFVFTGLDPNNYYLIFGKPADLDFVVSPVSHDGEASSDDSDVIDGITGRSATFDLDFDETEANVTAGYAGDPLLSISDVSVEEGGNGETNAVFTVTLSGPQLTLTGVDYATSPGSATAIGGDYDSTSGRLEFGPGVTAATVSVPVRGDLMYEEHEQFELVLSNPSNGVKLPASPSALATIINDDPIPQISVSDFNPTPVGYEDVEQTRPIFDEDQNATFVVTLTNPSYLPVEVVWQTDSSISFKGLPLDDAATPLGLPDADFVGDGGVLVFEPGETNQTITIEVLDDDDYDTDGDPATVRLDEPEETFFINLSNPKFALIADDRGYGIIQDDDDPVSVSIAPDDPFDPDDAGPMPELPFETHVTEGHGFSTYVTFHVTLSKRSGKEITVNYATQPGTAVEAVFSNQSKAIPDLPDYEATPQEELSDHEIELVFEPGETSKTFTVEVFGDNRVEPDEEFFVNLLTAENADIAADPATENNHVAVIIENDDVTPGVDYGPYSIRFSDVEYEIDEPDAGVAFAAIRVLRTADSSYAVAVFTTLDGTATAGQDYLPSFRELLVFEPGENEKTVLVPVLADDVAEGTERVKLFLQDPTGAPVNGEPNEADLVIRDGDMPELEILPPEFFSIPWLGTIFGIKEGSGEVFTDHEFTIQLKDGVLAPPGGVTVQYETVDLTARAGSDYTAVADEAFIPEGDNFVKVPVPVFEDILAEPTEKFAMRLSDPEGANMAQDDSVAVANIYDDDGVNVSGQIFYDSNENGFKDFNERGINGVDVTVSWKEDGLEQTATVTTQTVDGVDGIYEQPVFLGQVAIAVDGSTVTSPYKGFLIFGSGSYETTTNNETQSVEYLGAEGISPFDPVGYDNSIRFDMPSDTDDVGRGGTDDTIFGGPGDDVIDAGAGDDHVIGGHWMTATDSNAPVNLGDYDADVTVVTDPSGGPDTLHNVYDEGPIFSVDTSALPAGGSISGEIWEDANDNSTRQGGDSLFGEEVIVHLFDDIGNPVNSVVTTDGQYEFTGLYLKEDGSDSKYIVAFELPQGWTFVSPNVGGDETADSDVLAGNRADKVTLNESSPTVDHVDAGVKPSDTIPVSNSGGFEFSEIAYTVNQADGTVSLTLVRGDSTTQRAVVFRTEDGTGVAPTHYSSTTGIVVFNVGETLKTVEIPIHDAGLGLCETVYFTVTLREPTGRPLDDTLVYVYGDGEGNLTDDDYILGGDDWDIIIGDSGEIPAPVVMANPASLNTITYSGGPGKDEIHGGNGPDFIHGQLDDDLLAGNEGQDVVRAGLGDDVVWAELDDDDLDGQHGEDTVVSRRDVVRISMTPLQLIHHGNREGTGPALSTFELNDSFEIARIFAGATDNLIDIGDWAGEAYIFGGDGEDTLIVDQDTDMILKDVTLSFPHNVLFALVNEFFKDAAVSLSDGETYHLGSLENVTLVGGASANTLNASGYSRKATLIGLEGDDELIGGSNDDTFLYEADSPLGTDTITGNGGDDRLDFSPGMTAVFVDLSVIGVSQLVNGNLNLILNDEIETVRGGDGDDQLTGNNLDNTLLGGPGDDTLAGGPGDETYAFDTDEQWGTETIVENAGEGHDILDFSDTTGETIVIDLNVTSAQPVNGNLTLIVQDGAGDEGEIEGVIGGALNDEITGNSFNNTLRGGSGVDTIAGGDGNDLLDGGAGNDDLDGGPGEDTIEETANTDFFLSDSLMMRGTGEIDRLANIEIAHLNGGHSANTFDLTGWSGSGSVDGRDDTSPLPPPPFIDTLIVSEDADFVLTDAFLQITNGSGTRTINLTGIDSVELTGGAGDNTIDASAFSGSTILVGGLGDDILIGGGGADTILGGEGNDVLSGNRGNDILNGGNGNDQINEDLSGETEPLHVGLSDRLLTIEQTSPVPPMTAPVRESDDLISIESSQVLGSPQNDSFDATSWTLGALSLDGGGGDDRLTVEGNDRVFDPDTGDVLESGDDEITATDTELVRTGYATISLNSMEAVVIHGLGGEDVIDASGFSGLVRMIGGSESDTLIAGGALGAMVGDDPSDPDVRPGDDRFVFLEDGSADVQRITAGGGDDTLDFSDFASGVMVDLSVLGVSQVVLAGNLELVLNETDIERVIGGSGDDQLTGSGIRNVFTGGLGDDAIDGGGGQDRIVETADFNFTLTDASLSFGGATDTLTSIEEAELTGGDGSNSLDASAFTGAAFLNGAGGDDILIGGIGGNELTGGAGDDLLRGGANGDFFIFDVDEDLGSDTIEDSGLGGIDVLNFADTSTTGVDVSLAEGTHTVHPARLTLTIQAGTVLEAVIGTSQSDIIIGNAEDNLFLPGEGNDVVDGAGGTDSIFAIRDADMILTDSSLEIGGETDALANMEQANLSGGEGSNRMDASAFTLGGVVMSGGAGHDVLLGGSGNDQLRGNDGNDALNGGEGDDVLNGGAGRDVLNGGGTDPDAPGTDDDTLSGGADNDTYVFDQSQQLGSDTVTELPGQGFFDVINGAGLSGVDIDLFMGGEQIISDHLRITLTNPGEVEDAF